MKALVFASCMALFFTCAAQAQTVDTSTTNKGDRKGINVETKTSNPEMTKRSSGSIEAGPNSVEVHPVGQDAPEKSQPNR